MSTADTNKRKSKASLYSAIYLAAMLFFIWGYAVARYQVFPWVLISGIEQDILAFVEGDQDDDTTIAERLVSDFDIVPERQIRHFFAREPEKYREIALDGQRVRRESPRLWISPLAPDHYRIIAGAFDFEKALWGAILLDPSGKVVHRWHMNGEIDNLTDQADVLKNLYGLGFFPDGSAAFTMQERLGGLVKLDVCSRVLWTRSGLYHHVVSPTEDHSAFWTFGGQQHELHPTLLLIDAATGTTVREINMADVERANPGTLIFNLTRQKDTPNATHPNDIEPLPSALADAYPDFSAGDLLLSYHTTNLVFVLDPESLKIKWWYVGAGDGQHDPDWREDGTISLFNNNYRVFWRGAKPVSTIVEIDPVANAHRILVDGGSYDFYSSINGHHQMTPNGTVIITSSTQGRIFEVDLDSNEPVFEFVNAYDWDEGRTLHLSESFIVDKEQAERWIAQDCSQR